MIFETVVFISLVQTAFSDLPFYKSPSGTNYLPFLSLHDIGTIGEKGGEINRVFAANNGEWRSVWSLALWDRTTRCTNFQL